MLRSLISKFNQSLARQLAPARKQIAAPVRVCFAPEIDNERNQEMEKSVGVSGETIDISRTGVAFVVSSIRIKERYLVGQNRKLNIEVDLPSGKLQMQVLGVRYQKVGEHLSMEKYFIGAHIVRIDSDNNALLNHFLKTSTQRQATAQKGLELG